MYDATLGRFLQRDPIEFAAGDVNLYEYVRGRPTGVTDPRGLFHPLAGLDPRLVRFLSKALELNETKKKYPNPNEKQKELIKILEYQITVLCNQLRELKKGAPENMINVQVLEQRYQQLQKRVEELQK